MAMKKKEKEKVAKEITTVREAIGGEFANFTNAEIKNAINELVTKYEKEDYVQLLNYSGEMEDHILLTEKAGEIIFALWKNTRDFTTSFTFKSGYGFETRSRLPFEFAQGQSKDGKKLTYVRIWQDKFRSMLDLIVDAINYEERMEEINGRPLPDTVCMVDPAFWDELKMDEDGTLHLTF